MDLHDNLEYQFRENLMEMGKGHQEAADQVKKKKNQFHFLKLSSLLFISRIMNMNG
jgi:hypothetical protein